MVTNKFEIRRLRLAYSHYINQINNEGSLYNTGDSTQYSIITYKGKEPKKTDLLMYIYVSHNRFAVAKHCKSIVLQYEIKVKKQI